MSSRHVSHEIRREFPPDHAEPEFEIADVFRRYGDEYRATHSLSFEQARAMHAIEVCRTSALGAHVDECDRCRHKEISYNSCRNRHCPKCGASQRSAWVDARELELLPIQYFHFVFTLPDALLPLVRFNAKRLYNLLFHAAAETLRDFARRRWKADLGIVMVLHTWGQTMNEHPHVHCIVFGGALKRDRSKFVPAPKNYLFPIRALSPVFRAKFIEGLARLRTQGKLSLDPVADLAQEHGWAAFESNLHTHDWVVHTERPFAEPDHLIRYLGRYVNRIAMANHRLQSIDEGMVRFSYKDNRVKGDDEAAKRKTMCLSAAQFIKRFLSHVLPPGFHRIRYFGLLAGAKRKQNLTRCRELLGLSQPHKPYIPDMDAFLAKQGIDPRLCPKCLQGHLRCILQVLSFHDPPEGLLPDPAPATAHA